MSLEEAESSTDDLPDSAAESVDAPASDMADDAEMGDSETAAEPWRPRHNRNEPRGPEYRPFTSKFDEIVGAEDLCDPRSSSGCAAISTSSCRICKASWRGSPTGCSGS